MFDKHGFIFENFTAMSLCNTKSERHAIATPAANRLKSFIHRASHGYRNAHGLCMKMTKERALSEDFELSDDGVYQGSFLQESCFSLEGTVQQQNFHVIWRDKVCLASIVHNEDYFQEKIIVTVLN
ncbi:uncharacterized protein LOC117332503 isoform X2 [Pecten maximus]|uniref:uncharacterized protein LOC117332503 isoform X2 n=1 Tax=Pecten maximus TaxID=6579 RepID=UPI001458E4F5|nr:uncharacterized protein LOC117332503 isoform X2 [Pecten maximus]